MGKRKLKEARVMGPYLEDRIGGKRYRVVQVTADGRHTSFYASTPREAKVIMRACEHAMGVGSARKVTLQVTVTAFIEHKLRTAAWSCRTEERTGADLKFFAKGDADRSIAKVDAEFVRQYLKRIGHLALASQKTRFHSVCEFAAWCTRKGYWKANPCLAIDPAEKAWVGKRARRTMGRGKLQLRNSAEVAAYLRAAAQLRSAEDRVASVLPVLTGMRSGEVRHLRVADVDLLANRLWIRSVDDDEAVEGWDVKTAASQRTVGIPDEVYEDFDQLCRDRNEGEHVFSSNRNPGRAYDRRWLNRMVQEVCRRAGTRVVCAHGLRDTYTSLLTALAQVSPAEIARLVGHADQGQTAKRHYIGAPAHQPALPKAPGASAHRSLRPVRD